MLHDNPFGMIDITGEQNRYLLQISRDEHEEFQWLDITPFNLAYWQGIIGTYTHTLTTHLPGAGAPGALTLAGKIQRDWLTIYWAPGPAGTKYNVYRMGPPDYRYEKVSSLQSFYIFTDSFNDYPGSSACFYVVTAVDAQGRESGFSNPIWLPVIQPTAAAALPDGSVLVQGSARPAGFALLSPSMRWLHSQPVPEAPGMATGQFALNPDGWLVIPNAGISPGPASSLYVYNPPRETGFQIGVFDPGQLDYPTGVAWWSKQGYAVPGPYALDDAALLLAHFDGSLDGAWANPG